MNKRRPASRRHCQQGVVLLMSLIILTVLLAASAALVRSFDTTLTQAGNLAFKRDLANQAEVAMPVILGRFTGATGALNSVAARGSVFEDGNYSHVLLPTNAQGIPTDLLLADDDDFDALAYATTGNDIEPANLGVRVRYVVDRMCESAVSPAPSTLLETEANARCSGVDLESRAGSRDPGSLPVARQINYRVSVRVDGPRNTQAFFQTVFSL